MNDLPTVLTAARALPPQERVALLDALYDEVPPEQWTPPDAATMEEVNRRSDLLDRGELTTTGWSEVRRRVRREVGLDD